MDGKAVAYHEDINDSNQMVMFKPWELVTLLNSSDDFSSEGLINRGVANIGSNITLTDRVNYTGLVPGDEYELRSWLVEEDENHRKVNILNAAEGKDYVSTVVTADTLTGSGFWDVGITFNAFNYRNKSVIAYQELYASDGILVALHQDPHDSQQTVHFAEPSITTQAEGEQGDVIKVNPNLNKTESLDNTIFSIEKGSIGNKRSITEKIRDAVSALVVVG